MNKFINRVYNSKNFGKFKIVKEISDLIHNDRIFEIEFLNTGFKTIASYNAIRHGSVKDKLVPTVAGIGYIGYTEKVTDEDFYLYRIWNDMINRCYNINDNDYYLYGAIGIKVEESWLNYTNFKKDVKLLPWFEKKLQFPNLYQLDKDYLQFNIPKNQRVYSKNTCIWISKFDNIMIMNREYTNSSGYYGVFYKDGAWCTRINNKIIGRFICPEAAANLFNYLYPTYRSEFNDINLLNNVKLIPFEELKNYTINKQSWFNDYPAKE